LSITEIENIQWINVQIAVSFDWKAPTTLEYLSDFDLSEKKYYVLWNLQIFLRDQLICLPVLAFKGLVNFEKTCIHKSLTQVQFKLLISIVMQHAKPTLLWYFLLL